MPVPASYNDITEIKELRDHVGVVVYSRYFYISNLWFNPQLMIWIRFSSVHYAANVV